MVNTRKRKEKTPLEDLNTDVSRSEGTKKLENSENLSLSSAQESDVNKELTVNSSQPTTEDEDKSEESKPTPCLRLVPLNLLLKPEIINPPKKSAIQNSRNTKKSSYIEVSSGDESSDQDQSKISTQSSSSEASEIAKGRDWKKKQISTKSNSKSKFRNGNSLEIFKEPMSPNRIAKNSKNLSMNLNKMPENVNKLMKSYRIESETSVLSWSESEDFENMIETSKIDRTFLDQEKNSENTSAEEISTSKNISALRKRGSKPKVDKSPVKKKSKNPLISSFDDTGPTRSRSTRHAALNRKAVIDHVTSSSSSSEESDLEESDFEETDIVKAKYVIFFLYGVLVNCFSLQNHPWT